MLLFQCFYENIRLVELPNGNTPLYDAGSISDGVRAQQTIQATFWERKLSHIDALVVSHADIDHFNAVPGLMHTIPVGRLFIARPFLDFKQRGVVKLCQAARDTKVPIRIVQSGDRLKIDESVTVEVLYPDVEDWSSHDNANSIVLLIEYAGRRILLTGDLEGVGLRRLLQQSPCDVEILLSPHHGSPKSNSPPLAQWAQPEWVVVSGGSRRRAADLQPIYGEGTCIRSTSDRGAVTFEISPNGTIRESCYCHQTLEVPRL